MTVNTIHAKKINENNSYYFTLKHNKWYEFKILLKNINWKPESVVEYHTIKQKFINLDLEQINYYLHNVEKFL